MVVRTILILFVFVLFQSPEVRRFVTHHHISANPVVRISGVILCAAGIAFAIWARVHLGRNWGVPMSLREGHELITSGPYRFVRHPIYTGILLAALGSGLTAGTWWFVAFTLFFAYFSYSAKIEEREMLRQFPDQYPEYKRRTRGMIVPF